VRANPAGETFALCHRDGQIEVSLMAAGGPVQVAAWSAGEAAANEILGGWYPDGCHRVWTRRGECLVVASGERLETVAVAPSAQVRLPPVCEWRPGHVAVLWAGQLVVANLDRVTVHTLPGDPRPSVTSPALWRVGDRCLAWAEQSRVVLCDPEAPGDSLELLPPEVVLGSILSAAPDGRLLLSRQDVTRREPPVLCWFDPLARRISAVPWADPALAAWFAALGMSHRSVVCADSGEVFLLTGDRVLVRVRRDGAEAITPSSGLAVASPDRLAAWGPSLVLAGPARITVWDTDRPLRTPPLERLSEWPLRGPCIQDRQGCLRAFLADRPGYISRYDGRVWTHLAWAQPGADFGEMTADDRGRLQIALERGSLLVEESAVRRFPEDADGAWLECLRTGSTCFAGGATAKPWHWTNQAGRAWFGGELRTPALASAAGGARLPGRWGWVDPDGRWYRFGDGRTAVSDGGRWRPAPTPAQLLVGADGIRSFDAETMATAPERWLPALLSAGQYWAVDRGALPAAGAALRVEHIGVPLAADMAYRPDPAGGGWLGCRRVFAGVIREVPGITSVLLTPYGRFVVEGGRLLKRFPSRPLRLTVVPSDRLPGVFRVTCCYADDRTPVAGVRVSMTACGELLAVPGDDTANDSPAVPGHVARGTVIECQAVAADGQVSGRPCRIVWQGRGPKTAGPGELSGGPPPLPPPAGQAVPAAGVVDLAPLEFEPATGLPAAYGELGTSASAPLWRVLPAVLGDGQSADAPQRLADTLLADAEGRVWVGLRSRRGDPAPYLVWDGASRQWLRTHLPAGASAPVLSPAGRLHTAVPSPALPLERALLELCGRTWHRVTTIASESGSAGLAEPICWDGAGRLWNWGGGWLARWDGYSWCEWQVPVGSSVRPQALPDQAGLVVANASGVLLADGAADPRRLTLAPGVALADEPPGCVPLAGKAVLVCGSGRDESGAAAWGWMRLPLGPVPLNGTVLGRPRTNPLVADGCGSVLFWDPAQVLLRLDGATGEVRRMDPGCPLPAAPRYPAHVTALVSTRGEVVVQPDPGGRPPLMVPSLVVWREGTAAAAFGLADGVPAGEIQAWAEDREGRLWLLRRDDLLVYTPGGTRPPRAAPPATATPEAAPGGPAGPLARTDSVLSLEEAYPDWTAIVCRSALDGVGGDVWYLTERALVWSDGAQECSWPFSAATVVPQGAVTGPPRTPRPFRSGRVDAAQLELTSEVGALVRLDGSGQGSPWHVARFGAPLERVESHADGILALVAAGAARFSSWGAPPVVTPDGRVCCGNGRFWTGDRWVPVVEGRPALDAAGRVHLLSKDAHQLSDHGVHEVAGEQMLATGQARACRLDLHGRAWCEETDGTGATPTQEHVLVTVVAGSKVQVQLAGPTGKMAPVALPESDSPDMQAGPIAPGLFWVRHRGSMWVLSAGGLSRAGFSCPVPATWDRPVRLRDGRWAFVPRRETTLFLAPPGADIRARP